MKLSLLFCFAATLVLLEAAPVRRSTNEETSEILGDLEAKAAGNLNVNFIPLKSCKDLYDNGHRVSGVYTIDPRDDGCPISVFCDMSLDMDGKKGWIVIQRRVDNAVDFNRTLSDYEFGFGQLDGNFWLGLGKMKRILDSGKDGYELYMGMQKHDGVSKFASWDKFDIGTKASDWKLTISTGSDPSSGFCHSAGVTNSLMEANDKKFSTYDNDCDTNSNGNCAKKHEGGWWYGNCHEANPNGHYYPTDDNGEDYNGIIYTGFTGEKYSLKTIFMAIYPK